MTTTTTAPPIRGTGTDAPAISARGLVRTFGDHRAVDGIDLDVQPGEILGVLGPNGAGKTTTLRMLATLLPIEQGHAEIFGVDVRREPHRVRQLLGVTGQYASVDEGLTARENLWMFARLHGHNRARSRRTASDLLEEFGLTADADKTLAKFSGGMRRRLDLAASLINRPPLIFLDEPTTGLDPRTRNQMWDTIRTLVDRGSTILLTTQYLEEADQLADRIAVIDRGHKVAQGTPEQLKESVGGSSLHLVLDNPDLTDLATTRITDVNNAQIARGQQPGTLTIPLQHADRAAPILLALRDAGISVASLSVHKPTLDEVFLSITGRTATETTAQSAETASWQH